jgi:hypothetical protein
MPIHDTASNRSRNGIRARGANPNLDRWRRELNKRKKVAWHKHLKARKKAETKQKATPPSSR